MKVFSVFVLGGQTMTRFTFALLALALILTPSMFADGPCIVTKVIGQDFPSGSYIPVYASTRPENCPAASVASGEGTAYPYSFRLWKRNPETGELVSTTTGSAPLPMASEHRPTQVALLTPVDGEYLLTTQVGDADLETLTFRVGAVTKKSIVVSTNPAPPPLGAPFVRSSKVRSKGVLYGRVDLGSNQYEAEGYLFQLDDGVEVYQNVTFRLELNTGSLVTYTFTRGGTFEGRWVRAEVDERLFNFTAPIYAAVRNGGLTSIGVIYNPSEPEGLTW
jgi:hypothetical protein